MSIRIRIYPQPGSIGAIRVAQRRRGMFRLAQQRMLVARQNQLLQLQQQRLAATSWLTPSMGSAFGYGYGNAYGTTSAYGAAYGTPFGYGTGFGTGYASPFGAYTGSYASPLYTTTSSYLSSPLLGASYLTGAWGTC